MSTAPSWDERARCRGYFDVFFPALRGDAKHVNHTQALRFCVSCPVKRQCLELAMAAEGSAAAGARYGVFGGLTPAQRRELWDARQKAVAA
jgi:hypothetical protein